MSVDEFRLALRNFASSHDVDEHHAAAKSILESLDLDLEYEAIRSEGGRDRAKEVFMSFAEVGDEELVGQYERQSLLEVSRLTSEYFEKHSYDAFARMVFVLTVESLLEFYDQLSEVTVVGEDISELYRVLDEQIYIQMFLLEHMAHGDNFHWGRQMQIVEQSLAALTVCFTDIYNFLGSKDDMDESYEDVG
jgi:hypothetical protein